MQGLERDDYSCARCGVRSGKSSIDGGIEYCVGDGTMLGFRFQISLCQRCSGNEDVKREVFNACIRFVESIEGGSHV